MPDVVAPMRAAASERLPADDAAWAFEVKWDGVRAIAFVTGGRLRLQSRTLLDITGQYPEVAGLADALAGHDAVLDGEIVAFDAAGRPSFELLQQRINTTGGRVAARMSRVAVSYLAFDLLYLDGRSLTALPYVERRARLESLGLAGPSWAVPRHRVGDGAALLAATAEQGLEGVVAKRADSPYEEGRRSRCWLKVKNVRRQELVVGGWLPGGGSRAGRLGSLLVGYHGDGGLRYAGRVGSGLTDRDLSGLGGALERLARADSPFAAEPPLPPAVRRNARFVDPVLVVEVAFSEWTRGGTLRAPRFKGLRTDKPAAEVVREL